MTTTWMGVTRVAILAILVLPALFAAPSPGAARGLIDKVIADVDAASIGDQPACLQPVDTCPDGTIWWGITVWRYRTAGQGQAADMGYIVLEKADDWVVREQGYGLIPATAVHGTATAAIRLTVDTRQIPGFIPDVGTGGPIDISWRQVRGTGYVERPRSRVWRYEDHLLIVEHCDASCGVTDYALARASGTFLGRPVSSESLGPDGNADMSHTHYLHVAIETGS